MKFVLGARALWVAGIVVTAALVAGCGGDGTSGTSAAEAVSDAGRAEGETLINRTSTLAPTITGTPSSSATVGQSYSFQPQTTVPTGTTATFTVANLPVWAKFNAATGQLSGTPAAGQNGQYGAITIVVSDGVQSAALTPFSITVAAATANTGTAPPAGTPASGDDSVTLSWQPPTDNTDGSALVNLKGYKIHYGVASNTYSQTIDVANAGLASYVVDNLTAGTYFFAITSYNSAGVESALSAEVSTTLD